MITSLFLSTHLWRLTSLFALSLSFSLSVWLSMPCYCPVAGKEENDWAIKSHPKVQKEAADCFFSFWKLPFASETAIFGQCNIYFFLSTTHLPIAPRRKCPSDFYQFCLGIFFFLAGEMELWNNVNTVEGDDRKTVRRRRRRLRHLFFCLLSFPSSHLAVVVCWTLLPLRDRLHYVHLPLLHTCAFFFLLLLRPAALVYSVSKESKMGDRKGFSQCPFETSHRPWLFGNPRPCCCLHRNDPRVDKLSRRKEIGEGRSTSTAPKSHWFFIIIIIIFFLRLQEKDFPLLFFFIFTRPLSATTLHELISVRLPAFDVDPNLPSRRAKYHRGEKEGTDGNYLFFSKNKKKKKKFKKERRKLSRG